MAAAQHRQAQSAPSTTSFNPPPATIPRRASDAPNRPVLTDRSMSFPTPPSSASSITNGNADLPWVSQTGLTLDTSGIHPVTRSLPGTPATSPSSAVHTGNQTYGALTDSQLHHRQSLNFEPSFKRESVTQLHLGYPSNSQFSSRRASSASDMGPPPSAVHSRLSTVDKDSLDTKHEPLPESHEEGYSQGDSLPYGVPPGTPISASSNQVYTTPSAVAMKGRVENPGTPTHGHSPGGNNAGWSKHDAQAQTDYSIQSQGHARQLSYTIRSEDHSPMVPQNGVNRNIFDTNGIDRDTKLSSLDYHHGDDLPGDLPNEHNLSALQSSKPEIISKDGPPSSKRRRTINQDSMPYGMSGKYLSQHLLIPGHTPPQSTSDLAIPEGGLAANGSILNAPDPSSWTMGSSYADDYGTPILSDPTNGRKRPPSRK